jgi:hypothetical protein
MYVHTYTHAPSCGDSSCSSTMSTAMRTAALGVRWPRLGGVMVECGGGDVGDLEERTLIRWSEMPLFLSSSSSLNSPPYLVRSMNSSLFSTTKFTVCMSLKWRSSSPCTDMRAREISGWKVMNSRRFMAERLLGLPPWW